jgi:hypothetical protein
LLLPPADTETLTHWLPWASKHVWYWTAMEEVEAPQPEGADHPVQLPKSGPQELGIGQEAPRRIGVAFNVCPCSEISSGPMGPQPTPKKTAITAPRSKIDRSI